MAGVRFSFDCTLYILDKHTTTSMVISRLGILSVSSVVSERLTIVVCNRFSNYFIMKMISVIMMIMSPKNIMVSFQIFWYCLTLEGKPGKTSILNLNEPGTAA